MQVIEREKKFWEHHAEFELDGRVHQARHRRLAAAVVGRRARAVRRIGLLTGHVPTTYASYIGLDLSRSLLTTLRAKMPALPLVQGDAEDLCFSSESFDIVLVFAGLHHLPHYEARNSHAYRTL